VRVAADAILRAVTQLDHFEHLLDTRARIAAVEIVESLPRSPIGKVLKRELRDAYARRAT